MQIREKKMFNFAGIFRNTCLFFIVYFIEKCFPRIYFLDSKKLGSKLNRWPVIERNNSVCDEL